MLVKTVAEIKSFLEKSRAAKKTIAFVPTMGALHEGHLALVKKAQEVADIVVVSIYVNKAQFNDVNDYLKYPKTLDDDLVKLDSLGINCVFAPQENELENIDFTKYNIPDNLKNCLCGTTRPGHFEGVTMIVSKFFNIIKPDIAIFGQKDFQQCLVVKNLAENFYPNIKILLEETAREKSGLAMSSRNQRLSELDKIKAANIYRILQEIKNEISLLCHPRVGVHACVNQSQHETGAMDPRLRGDDKGIEKILTEKKSELLKIGFEKIDYLEIRDEENLKLITSCQKEKSLRIFVAVYLAQVRLIDNLKINIL